MSSFNRVSLIVACLTVVAAFATPSQAAISAPPSWSPMAMLNVSLNTTTNKIEVVDEDFFMGANFPAVMAINTFGDPAVTTGPTSYGRPNMSATTFGSYDPSKPWSVLNGKAFSRLLGWFDPLTRVTGATLLKDQIAAQYGAGASVWIQLQTASPGLEFYFAPGMFGVGGNGSSDPYKDAGGLPIIYPSYGGYAPILGTAGSSAAWKWDWMMDHNVTAIPQSYITSPNQTFTATFRVFVGDAQGNEIFNADQSSTATTEVWTWKAPANTPEPATIAMLVLGAAVLSRRRQASMK